MHFAICCEQGAGCFLDELKVLFAIVTLALGVTSIKFGAADVSGPNKEVV